MHTQVVIITLISIFLWIICYACCCCKINATDVKSLYTGIYLSLKFGFAELVMHHRHHHCHHHHDHPGWHRASAGHQSYGTFPLVTFVEATSKKLWTGQVKSKVIIVWFQNIQIDDFLPRIVYLTNLDYRQGLINFEDLNSDRSYDPATAFYQVNFVFLSLSLTEIFSESASQYSCCPVAVKGVPWR